MTLVTLVAGYFILLPGDFKGLGESATAQQLFLSNFYFWRSSGYFATAAELKPLLHTWSLAVEEQFYIFYPLVLIFLGRFKFKWFTVALVLITLASFSLSVWGVRNAPSATFFLLPPRVWELTLGGLIWCLPVISKGKVLNETMSLSGLLLILIPSMMFHESTPFPGTNAIYPCVGAALLIFASRNELTLIGKLLSLKPVVFIGLISYSLYLWHWPILVFAKNVPALQNSGGVALALGLSFVAAIISWRFVETPVRKQYSPKTQSRIVWGLVASFPLILCLSAFITLKQGMPERMPAQISDYMAVSEESDFHFEAKLEDAELGSFEKHGDLNGANRCLVWGDSHAMHLMPGIVAAAQEKGFTVLQATHSATCPLLDIVHVGKSFSGSAGEFGHAVVNYVEANPTDTVVISGVWSTYAGYDGFEKQFAKTLDRLNGAGANIVIVLDVAVHQSDPPRLFAQRKWWSVDSSGDADLGTANEDYLAKNKTCNSLIRQLAKGKATVIDPADIFLQPNGRWPMILEGKLLYKDRGHLSHQGGLLCKPVFDELFTVDADVSE